MEIPYHINEILNRLEEAGYRAYIVGGCVRDSLMGLVPHDYDITTSALPEDTERVFADCRIIETGIKHGTVTVLYKGIGVEITTFRVDGEYTDSRRPDSVTFTDRIEEDLSRRDFTINGIAYNPEKGLTDPFGGQQDISAGVIRCIGDPERRFSEDSLRILRALRFSSVLGFVIENNTAAAIREHKADLDNVSRERVFSELTRLLCGKDVRRVMMEFPEVFAQILPPLKAMIGYEQCSKYHNSDLYEHTARAVEAAPAEPAMRLAMLFHDMGKPACKSVGEDGQFHFYGHAEESVKIADGLLRELKSSNELRERIREIVRYHDIPVETSPKYIRRALSKHGIERFRDIMYSHMADDSAKADFVLPRIETARRALELAEEIAAQKPCLTLKSLAISGRDLLEFLPPSRQIGEILSTLLGEVVEEKLPNEKTALLKRARELAAANSQ
ncbi:MAG: HD domain-containing protein [Oscillospiraceae bacterium]|nr:HD domain-containing protein [Oscillospiraceae bacterium]